MHEQGDIVADIQLYRTEDGGRRDATPADVLGCPLFLEGRYYDGRLLLKDVGPIAPGGQARVAISFLVAEEAKKHFRPGTRFKLWEGRFVGEGEVVEVS